MTAHEMAELLLYDFARRAQQDEDLAYRKYKRFSDASERVELAREECQILIQRRIQCLHQQ
jgi:hypothetical protein